MRVCYNGVCRVPARRVLEVSRAALFFLYSSVGTAGSVRLSALIKISLSLPQSL